MMENEKAQHAGQHGSAFLRNHQNALLTLLVAIVFGVFPLLGFNDYLVHIGCMISINIILALGMHMVTGAAGQINMGQYGFYCIGAYSSAILTATCGLPYMAALALTILISAFFGLLVGVPALKVEGPYLSLCTIGFGESVRLVINAAGWAGKANGIIRIPKLSFFGWTMYGKTMSYYFIMVFMILSLIIVNNMMTSGYGRKFKAIKDDPLAANVMGVNVVWTKLLAFMICAIFGGIAGSLYSSYVSYIQPTTFMQALQTNFLLMIVLGGLGSQWGALIGAALVTVAYESTRSFVQYQQIAFGMLMIIIVLFLRKGIIGTILSYRQDKLIRAQHELNKREGANIT